jgi:uncharacterized protein (DUF433 family)
MDWRDRIVVDPAVAVGKPVLRGTRLSVGFVLDLLANGWTAEQLTQNYPGVSDDDVRACLAYAKDAVEQERVYPLAWP